MQLLEKVQHNLKHEIEFFVILLPPFCFIFSSMVFVGCQIANVGAIVFNISCLLFLNYICSSSFHLFTFKISIGIIEFREKLKTLRLSSK